jgi:RNA polymerase sigma factor (sigma-70 family)
MLPNDIQEAIKRDCERAIAEYDGPITFVPMSPRRTLGFTKITKRQMRRKKQVPDAAERLRRWHLDQEERRQRTARTINYIRECDEYTDNDTVVAARELTSLNGDKVVTASTDCPPVERKRSRRKTTIEVSDVTETATGNVFEEGDAVIDETEQYPQPKALKRKQKKLPPRPEQSSLAITLYGAVTEGMSPYEQRIAKCVPRLQSFAFSRVNDPAHMDDLVAATIERALNHPEYEFADNLPALLQTILKNIHIDDQRNRKWLTPYDEFDGEIGIKQSGVITVVNRKSSPDDYEGGLGSKPGVIRPDFNIGDTQQWEVNSMAEDASKDLTPSQQAAVRMQAYGCDYNEIATELGCSPNTVGSLISRAYQKLETTQPN